MINKQIYKSTNLQINYKNTKKFAFGVAAVSLLICLFAYLLIICRFAYSEVMAQAISLSITPPLFELMIQPGKEVKQTYSITNNGGDTVLTPKIVYFAPADEAGNVELTDFESPDWVKYSKDQISIKNGIKTDFNVIFSPPKDTEEIDHFLTLVFESKEPVDLLNQNSTSFTSQIGTNILLTISKDGNPKKSAEILEFSATKIIDSLFGNISYDIALKNNGNSFWKPIGKIISNNETLKIASQNIISGSNRKIYCLENENLVKCELKNKFRIGKIISTLEFSMDDDPKIYKSQTISYSFPFSVLLVFIILGIIFKVWQKRR